MGNEPRMGDSTWQSSDGLKDLHMYEVIGAGQHSKVHKIRKKRTIGYYALKITNKSERKKLMREVRALHALQHGSIVRFYMWYETNNHLWTVTEYCVGGNLQSLLALDKKLPEDSVHGFSRDVAEALQHLHSQSLVHCDLKLSNVLLDENGGVKLAGFGMSHSLQQIQDGGSAEIIRELAKGHASCIAPELRNSVDATFSFASDVWAFGCMIYEMISGSPPPTTFHLPGSGAAGLGEILGCSSDLADLLSGLLQSEPSQRILWRDLCTHTFWKSPLKPLPIPEQTRAAQLQAARALPEMSSEHLPAAAGHAQEAQSLEERPTSDANEMPEEFLQGPAEIQLPHSTAESGLPTPCDNSERNQERDPSELIWEQTEAVVKPIVPSKWSQPDDGAADALPGGLPTWTIGRLEAAPMMDGQQYVARLTAALQNKTMNKAVILRHVLGLCKTTAIANLLVNSALAVCLVQLLRIDGLSSDREQIVAIIGLLVRHATCIKTSFRTSGVLDVLLACLRSVESARVKRKAVATLGELLFFIASQEQDKEPTSTWSHLNSSDLAEGLLRLIDGESDEVVKHYALRSIENILQTQSSIATELSSEATAVRLVRTLRHARTELVRSTALTTLAGLLRHNNPQTSAALQSLPTHVLVSGLQSRSCPTQVAAASILCQLLVTPTVGLSAEDESCWTVLLEVLHSTPHALLRAKVFLAFSLAARKPRNCGSIAMMPEIAVQAMRVEQKGASHLRDCAAAFLQQSPRLVSSIFERGTEGATASGQTAKDLLSDCSAVLELLTSSSYICARALSSEPLLQLSRLLLASSGGQNPDLEAIVIQLCEAACECRELVEREKESFSELLMPALAGKIGTGKDCRETLFSCLQLLCSLSQKLLSFDDSGIRNKVAAALEGGLLPHVDALLDEHEPISLSVIKLLDIILGSFPHWAHLLGRTGVPRKCLSYLELQHPNNRVYNVRVCKAFVEQGAISNRDLLTHEAVNKLALILDYAADNAADIFIEPVLQLIGCILKEAGSDEAGGTELLEQAAEIIPTALQLCMHESPGIASVAADSSSDIAELLPQAFLQAILAENGQLMINRLLEAAGSSVDARPIWERVMRSWASASKSTAPHDFSNLGSEANEMLDTLSIWRRQQGPTMIGSDDDENLDVVIAHLSDIAGDDDRL